MRYLLIICTIFFLSQTATGQASVTIEVTDENRTPLVGALLRLANGAAYISDGNGRFTFDLNGETAFSISFVGFREHRGELDAVRDTSMLVRLEVDDIVIDAVTVESTNDQQEIQSTTSVTSISAVAISDLPYLLGEQDVVKFVQTLPGISTGTDGNNGYYVRGGGVDQNMIELDRIQLYNTNHLFGFFSMFNSDAIDHIDFVHGGFTADIGGRLSSSLKIHTVNPDNEQVSGTIGAGLLAANLTIELPVIPEKSSLLVSYRRSYIDLITQNFFDRSSQIRKRTDYRFTDLIVKYRHELSARHAITLTGFGATDDYLFNSGKYLSNTIDWRTLNGGIQWNWILNDALDGEVYYNKGSYNQHFGADISAYEMNFRSSILSEKGGAVFYHRVGEAQLKYGVEAVFRRIKPNQVELRNGDTYYTLAESGYLPSLESAVFADGERRISDRVTIGVGLRMSGFTQLGPFDRYLTTEENILVDTIRYKKGQVVRHYLNPEPRARLIWLLSQKKSFKLFYDRTFQYVHLAPLSSVSLPTDIWVPSSQIIKPQASHQVSVGYHEIVSNSTIRFSIAAYYKWMANQLEYRNGAIVGYSQTYNYDDIFSFGTGQSTGLEFLLQKENGPLKYQLAYTLSKTTRRFSEISDKAFPAKYDRTHDLNAVASYQRGNWTFSSIFKLATGNALTLPTGKYVIGGNVISEYTSRNAFRMPTYHRMDLAVSVHPKRDQNSTFTFSVYNLYNRSNPYYIYFDVTGNVNEYQLDIDLQKVSLFPILPAFAYEKKF